MIALSIGKSSFDITVPMDNFPAENTKSVLKEKIESSGGSACIVAHLLSRWNNETYYSGIVGYDDYGSAIKKDLEASNVKTTYIETNYEKKSSSTFIIANKANTSRTILMVEPEVFHQKRTDYDVDAQIVYSDGFEYSASTAAFNKYQNAVSVLGASLGNGSDPKEVLALAKFAKYVVFSLDFAEELTKLKIDYQNPQTLLTLYKEVKEKYPYNNIIITLKNMGAMYQLGTEIKVMPTISVTEVDRTGAGDIFDGALSYGLAKGYDLETCIRLANIAGGLSTTKYGAKNSIPLLSEVISFYEQRFGALVDPNASQAVEQPAQTQAQTNEAQNVQTVQAEAPAQEQTPVQNETK